MFSKFSMSLVASLLLSLPSVASALPHTVFAVQPGTQRDALPDGTIPQAVITLILSNSHTACEDWRFSEFQPNKQYLLTRLSALPGGDNLTGCYEVPDRPGNVNGCSMKRGPFDGVEFQGAVEQENAGRIKSARFITGGYIKISDLRLNEDGTGLLKGFANVRFGDIATGGVIEADRCNDLIAPADD